MENNITENQDNESKPYNIVVPFNIPGKTDIGIIDLNKIFKLNINFDSLKILLEGLITAYKKTQEELENINAYNKIKNTKIESLEKKIKDMDLQNNESLEIKEESETFKDSKEILVSENQNKEGYLTIEKNNKKKSAKNSPKKFKKIHSPINNDLKLDIQVGNDEIINKIIKKVNGYELCINDLYEAVPLIQKEQYNNYELFNNYEEQLNKMKSKMNNLKEENNTLKNIIKENEEKFKDIEIKINEFNIIDILKSDAGEGTDKKLILGLISNFEKKFNMKIKFLEEKISKIDSSGFKMEKDTQNIKNSQNINKRQIDKIKKQLEEINIKEENINNTLEQNKEDLKDKLESKITGLEKNIKTTIDSLNSSVNKKLNSKNKANNKEVIIKETTKIINSEKKGELKDLQEAITDIKKQIKEILENKDLELIKSDILALKSGMNNYVLLPEFKDLQELSEVNNDILRKIKEEFEDYKISHNFDKEMVSIKLKLESVSNKVHDILNNMSNKNRYKNSLKSNPDDKYTYIDFKTFEEFKSHIAKEFIHINDNFNNSKQLIDELIQSVKNRMSFKDLKTLEDAIMSQMDDLKIAFSKKFADKDEVNKIIKYLDQQIKNIIQIYIKKIEKGDNWLLAKTPISNTLCASCESYIGDLKDVNNDDNIYIPWNKYQVKDSNNKLYRIGQGYSKMLQNLQLDENDKKKEQIKNILNFNQTEYSSGFGLKKIKTFNDMKKTIQQNLPKLKDKDNKDKQIMKKVNSTFSENNNIRIELDLDNRNEKPIITKIYKVNKEQH